MLLNKKKASYTVEMALVMPIVFGALIATLFFMLFLYQQGVNRALINKYSLLASNTITRAGRTPNGYFIVPNTDERKQNKSVYASYKAETYDYFEKNETKSYFAPLVNYAIRAFSVFKNTTVPNQAQVTFNRDESHIRIESSAEYTVTIPFYGKMTSKMTIVSTAPEINPSKYIRSVDDSHYLIYRVFELLSF